MTGGKLIPGGVGRAIVIVEFGHTRLGDIVQAITDLRYLREHLRIESLTVNVIDPTEFRLAAELVAADPLIGECLNLPYSRIRYRDYQLVLHYTVFKHCAVKDALRLECAPGDDTACYSLPAMRWDLERVHGESWQEFAYPFPLLAVPAGVLMDSRGNHRIYQREDERAWAVGWLEQAGVAREDRLVVLIDEASDTDKLLSRNCTRGVLEHFLRNERVKILLYDLREDGKQEAYREMLGAESFARLVFSTRNGLRRDLALLGAPQVRMILGPDTGIMHCAAGIHAALPAPAAGWAPLLLVYAGRWLGFNMWDFWSGSNAQCLVAYAKDSGPFLRPLRECPRRTEDFVRGLCSVGELTAAAVIESIEARIKYDRRREWQGVGPDPGSQDR